MFKFLKKESPKKEISAELVQNEDWTKDIKRSKKIGQEVEEIGFIKKTIFGI